MPMYFWYSKFYFSFHSIFLKILICTIEPNFLILRLIFQMIFAYKYMLEVNIKALGIWEI